LHRERDGGGQHRGVLARIHGSLAYTANYNETRAPAERQRSWYGTGAIPVVVIFTVVRLAVPRADWQSVTFSAPWARFLGLAILLAATALTLWARFALGLMWSAAPAVKEGHQLRTSGPYAITRHPIPSTPGC
jgi:protein-S-isoprenylcysteine O-methyltransferase Ste14